LIYQFCRCIAERKNIGGGGGGKGGREGCGARVTPFGMRLLITEKRGKRAPAHHAGVARGGKRKKRSQEKEGGKEKKKEFVLDG